MRQIGFFLEPTLVSLIRTAMCGRGAYRHNPDGPTWPSGSGSNGAAGRRAAAATTSLAQAELLRVGHLALGELGHQLPHLAELLDELVDGLHRRPRAPSNALAA